MVCVYKESTTLHFKLRLLDVRTPVCLDIIKCQSFCTHSISQSRPVPPPKNGPTTDRENIEILKCILLIILFYSFHAASAKVLGTMRYEMDDVRHCLSVEAEA